MTEKHKKSEYYGKVMDRSLSYDFPRVSCEV